MGQLTIKTRSNSPINPEFTKRFIVIAEEATDAPINLYCINAFTELTEENRQENIDIQNLAIILLLTNELLAVKWGNQYYIGDVDRMDNEFGFDENADDVTLLLYEL